MSVLPQDDLLLKHVKDCERINDFLTIYDSALYQASLDRIGVAQSEGGADAEEWAKEWARKLLVVVDDDNAKGLNQDRKICLALLYRMCDCWQPKNKSNATVSRDDIVDTFKDRRVLRILTLCVIMDRAQALYKMKIAGHPVGMHWYAQKHVDESDEWKEIDANYDGSPTINKRLFWLVDLLNLGGKVLDWLQPTKADWKG
jgi:hypothetical protein